MNARVKPITPSPRFSFPKPVSHAESIPSGAPNFRLKISSERKAESARLAIGSMRGVHILQAWIVITEDRICYDKHGPGLRGWAAVADRGNYRSRWRVDDLGRFHQVIERSVISAFSVLHQRF